MDLKCSILIMGRDASINQTYITSFLLKKYWTDCPYQLVLCTQTKKPKKCLYDRVIYTDSEMIWGDRLKIALEALETEYVILSPEDSFLQTYVNTKRLEECIEYMEKNKVGAVRLKNELPFVKPYNELYDIVPTDSIYRLCLHPMLYKTDYLMRFAEAGYSPWQFERKGSLQSRQYEEKILCVKEPYYDSVHAWSGGCWLREGYKVLKKEKIPCELYDYAPIYPWYKYAKDRVFMLVIRLAPNLINKIRIKQCTKNEKKLNT